MSAPTCKHKFKIPFEDPVLFLEEAGDNIRSELIDELLEQLKKAKTQASFLSEQQCRDFLAKLTGISGFSSWLESWNSGRGFGMRKIKYARDTPSELRERAEGAFRCLAYLLRRRDEARQAYVSQNAHESLFWLKALSIKPPASLWRDACLVYFSARGDLLFGDPKRPDPEQDLPGAVESYLWYLNFLRYWDSGSLAHFDADYRKHVYRNLLRAHISAGDESYTSECLEACLYQIATTTTGAVWEMADDSLPLLKISIWSHHTAKVLAEIPNIGSRILLETLSPFGENSRKLLLDEMFDAPPPFFFGDQEGEEQWLFADEEGDEQREDVNEDLEQKEWSTSPLYSADTNEEKWLLWHDLASSISALAREARRGRFATIPAQAYCHFQRALDWLQEIRREYGAAEFFAGRSFWETGDPPSDLNLPTLATVLDQTEEALRTEMTALPVSPLDPVIDIARRKDFFYFAFLVDHENFFSALVRYLRETRKDLEIYRELDGRSGRNIAFGPLDEKEVGKAYGKPKRIPIYLMESSRYANFHQTLMEYVVSRLQTSWRTVLGISAVDFPRAYCYWDKFPRPHKPAFLKYGIKPEEPSVPAGVSQAVDHKIFSDKNDVAELAAKQKKKPFYVIVSGDGGYGGYLVDRCEKEGLEYQCWFFDSSQNTREYLKRLPDGRRAKLEDILQLDRFQFQRAHATASGCA